MRRMAGRIVVAIVALALSAIGLGLGLSQEGRIAPGLVGTSDLVGDAAEKSSKHLLYIVDPRNGDTSTQVLVVDPDKLTLVHAIPAAYDPQVAVSPDGGRLYLTDTELPPEGFGQGTDMLTVIETGTWRVLARLESPDRIKHKVFGRDAMAFSPDGERLYIHKWRVLEGRYQAPGAATYPRSEHWWDVFEPDSGRFLPDPPQTANCGIGQPLFTPDGRTLILLCFQRSELVFVDLDSGLTVGGLQPRGVFGDWQVRGNPAGAALSPDGRYLYVLTNQGQVLVVDSSRQAIERGIELELPPDRRVSPGGLVLAPDGERFYVAVSGSVADGDGYAREVWVLDTGTWERTAVLQPQGRVLDLALSPDGARLYAVAPYEQVLTVLDTATGREIGRMEGLGETPGLVVVAPAP